MTSGSAAKALGGADALAAFRQVTDAVQEYLKLRETEETRRAQIESYKVLESERIRAAERVLSDYFSKVFDERAEQFEEMWARLDKAAEAGDGPAVAQLLNSIVSLAQKSPLAELTDLSQVRLALEDPNHEWEL